mmetsp:Transcript_4190/g.11563  ORF Transcript_4190/g.11563 Transcript_4190/m.11563 type:complete len:224 (+) Transcript_4190:3771-4442(+)
MALVSAAPSSSSLEPGHASWSRLAALSASCNCSRIRLCRSFLCSREVNQERQGAGDKVSEVDSPLCSQAKFDLDIEVASSARASSPRSVAAHDVVGGEVNEDSLAILVLDIVGAAGLEGDNSAEVGVSPAPSSRLPSSLLTLLRAVMAMAIVASLVLFSSWSPKDTEEHEVEREGSIEAATVGVVPLEQSGEPGGQGVLSTFSMPTRSIGPSSSPLVNKDEME